MRHYLPQPQVQYRHPKRLRQHRKALSQRIHNKSLTSSRQKPKGRNRVSPYL